MDILSLDATGQIAALNARRISARELLELTLAHTDRMNEAVNAVVARDPSSAFAAAQDIDDRRARGETVGALAGLPMTVKDTLDVQGLPASAGMRELLHRTAKDAVVVARARAADAIIWGKTNTPVKAADWQTVNPLYGRTNNPWDLQRTPGGSSGGSAAALASGMTALEIGADIGGSLRIPAGFCGVFAHKPSFGSVPQRGLVPPPDSDIDIDLAVVGPMARSARDLALLFSIIGDTAMPTPAADLKDMRFALWLDEPAFALDADVKSVLSDFARQLTGTGAIVEPVTSPVDVSRLMFSYMTLLCAIIGGDLTPVQRALYTLARGPAKLALVMNRDPLSLAQILLGHVASRSEWAAADAVRKELRDAMRGFFSRYDAILAPIAPTVAFPHNTKHHIARRKLTLSDGRQISYLKMYQWIALATLCDLPATAMPAGHNAAGLPVGIQIIGPNGGDARTLALAQAIETQLGGFRAPPL